MNVDLKLDASLPPAGSKDRRRKDLEKACQQFEAVFAKKLLGEMRKGVPESHFGDSAGSEIYKDLMDQALAEAMAKRAALGIGKMLFRQFERQIQEDAPASTEQDV